ncbi:hypothetical protein ABFT23_02985 [Nocardioides sp. C4-1]|uniref:hypothetical protein n=1 Tax=Nocardioides sp. C4-1 TaxID=3151851 RepID=UPI003265F7F0
MRRVYLHVGTPKTGTSYVQDLLFRNRERLADAGVRYPAEHPDDHFRAALDLMRLPWGGLEAEATGAWDRLATEVCGHDGPSIISHEILATASRSQVGRALESLGHATGDAGGEVHVVLSVRDLSRQIPAEWQENVKHRRTFTYAEFLAEIRDPERASRLATWFWGVQEVPAILDRWANDLPPEHVHLVTVPPRGGPPDELWRRFSRAFGLDDVELDLETSRANPSLGVPEISLLRRINQATNRHLAPAAYRPLVRELIAHQTLSERTDSPRLGLPPELRAWAGELEQAWADEVVARGYDVVGDLDDLVSERSGAPGEWADPDRARQRHVAAAALDTIQAVLLDSARLRDETERLRTELHDARVALERAYLRPTYRARAKVVRGLESGAPGRAVMRGYRALRGRSSRSA